MDSTLNIKFSSLKYPKLSAAVPSIHAPLRCGGILFESICRRKLLKMDGIPYGVLSTGVNFPKSGTNHDNLKL
jgi:hypothetical protein